jgi:hypothetical protein
MVGWKILKKQAISASEHIVAESISIVIDSERNQTRQTVLAQAFAGNKESCSQSKSSCLSTS